MKLRLVTEEVEVPDEVGKALLEKQDDWYKGQCLVEHTLRMGDWWYDVKVPSVFEEIKDA